MAAFQHGSARLGLGILHRVVWDRSWCHWDILMPGEGIHSGEACVQPLEGACMKLLEPH